MTDTNRAAGQIVGLYERHAAAWDRERGRGLNEEAWLRKFSGIAGAGSAVLDIGCGSGEPIARFLIEGGHTCTGVDSSPAMIAFCRARFPGHDWIVGDMRTLAIGTTFQGIVAWDSFFHLSHGDQRAQFPIFRAHAGRGAALMFTTGPDFGEAIGSFEGEALYHASLSPAEYRSLLDENGFDVVEQISNDATCGGHTIWLAQAR